MRSILGLLYQVKSNQVKFIYTHCFKVALQKVIIIIIINV